MEKRMVKKGSENIKGIKDYFNRIEDSFEEISSVDIIKNPPISIFPDISCVVTFVDGQVAKYEYRERESRGTGIFSKPYSESGSSNDRRIENCKLEDFDRELMKMISSIREKNNSLKLDYNQIADDAYRNIFVDDFLDYIREVIKVKKQEKEKSRDGSGYKILVVNLSNLSESNSKAKDIAKKFGLNTNGVSNETLWEQINHVSVMLSEKIKEVLSIKDHIYFEITNDGYWLVYEKEDYEPSDFVVDVLKETRDSYEEQVKRKNELQELIMDAYRDGKEELVKELIEEYNDILKVVSKKKTRLMKKGLYR